MEVPVSKETSADNVISVEDDLLESNVIVSSNGSVSNADASCSNIKVPYEIRKFADYRVKTSNHSRSTNKSWPPTTNAVVRGPIRNCNQADKSNNTSEDEPLHNLQLLSDVVMARVETLEKNPFEKRMSEFSSQTKPPELVDLSADFNQSFEQQDHGFKFKCKVIPKSFVVQVQRKFPNSKRKASETIKITEEKIPIEVAGNRASYLNSHTPSSSYLNSHTPSSSYLNSHTPSSSYLNSHTPSTSSAEIQTQKDSEFDEMPQLVKEDVSNNQIGISSNSSNGHWCSVCRDHLESEHLLEVHKVIHKNIPSYCQNCRVDLKPNYCTCQICGKTFRGMIFLKKHFMEHFPQPAFSCCFCGNKFDTMVLLQLHILTHSRKKPYTCSVCQKRFREKLQLMCHTSLLHPKTNG